MPKLTTFTVAQMMSLSLEQVIWSQ